MEGTEPQATGQLSFATYASSKDVAGTRDCMRARFLAARCVRLSGTGSDVPARETKRKQRGRRADLKET